MFAIYKFFDLILQFNYEYMFYENKFYIEKLRCRKVPSLKNIVNYIKDYSMLNSLFFVYTCNLIKNKMKKSPT